MTDNGDVDRISRTLIQLHGRSRSVRVETRSRCLDVVDADLLMHTDYMTRPTYTAKVRSELARLQLLQGRIADA